MSVSLSKKKFPSSGSERTSYIDYNPMPCLNWASLAFFKDKFLTVKVKLHIKSSLCFIRSW